jgi:hypothetical protein
MERRTVLGGGVLAALTGGAAARVAASDTQGGEGLVSERVARLLQDVVDELRSQRTRCGESQCAELELVRANQRTFARAQGKFPDYIDVSLDVWERIFDWTVRTGQHEAVERLPDGRYAIRFCFTRIVLRPELTSQYISLGYDVR